MGLQLFVCVCVYVWTAHLFAHDACTTCKCECMYMYVCGYSIIRERSV